MLENKGDLIVNFYIVNTLGPTWGVDKNEKELLLKTVLTSLSMAEEMMCSSISLPFISSGIYAHKHMQTPYHQ